MRFTILAGILTVIWTQRAEPAKIIAQMLLTYIFIDAIAAGGIAVALEVTDSASTWLIEKSTEGTSFVDNLFSLFNTKRVSAARLCCWRCWAWRPASHC